MARPRKTLPKNGLEIIRDCASRGVSETDLAKALGMDHKTWRRLRDENPETKAAWEEAKAIERDQLVGVLFEAATKDNNISAAMFLLKARHGYRDHGATEGDDQGRVSITFNLPAPMKPTDYGRLVEQPQETDK